MQEKAKSKLLNVEIAESEVYRLMQANGLGCYVKQFPTIDQDVRLATGEMVLTAVVEVYRLNERANGRADDRVVQDIGSHYVERDADGRYSPRDLAIAKEIALTKARRRAVLCYLGMEYEYEEIEPPKKRK